MIVVTLFRRASCPACDQAALDLDSLQAEIPHRLVVVDVDQEPALRSSFREAVPLVQVGPYQLRPPFTRMDLKVAISAAEERSRHLDEVGDSKHQQRVERGQVISGADRVLYWMSRHYMLVFNLMLLLYVGIPFLAPMFLKVGWTGPASVVYTIYSPLCHQLGYRSFFLYGEQPYYPRERAGIPGVLTYEQATGQTNLDNNLDPRRFRGNEQLGYKVALCERDIAIWGGLLLFGMLFAVTGRRAKPLPFWVWLLIGLVPVGLDGTSQLIAAFKFLPAWVPVRESTPFLRLLTGGLFGITTAWYMFPLIEESMRETRTILAKKFASIQQQ